jgi:hypothetical protein
VHDLIKLKAAELKTLYDKCQAAATGPSADRSQGLGDVDHQGIDGLITRPRNR